VPLSYIVKDNFIYYHGTNAGGSKYDNIIPADTAYFPANNTQNVSLNTAFKISFNKNVFYTAGKKIYLKNAVDNSIIETIAESNITGTGTNVIKFKTKDKLTYGIQYYIEFDGNKIINLDITNWYIPVLLFILGTSALTFRLGSIPKGLSSSEISTRSNLLNHQYSYQYLLHHLTSLLFTWYFVVLNYLNIHNLMLIRLSGYLCGIAAIYIFFYISKTFTNRFIGTITTMLFGSSLWFLQIVRNSQHMQFYSFVILLPIFMAILYYRKKNLSWLAVCSAILLGLSFYLPGMIWFGLLAMAINLKTLGLESKMLSTRTKIIASLLFLVVIAPIVIECISNHSLIYSILYIPTSINFHQIMTQLIDYPKYLFIQNSGVLKFSVGRLPLVNFASTILLIFSGFWIYKNWRNPITQYIYYSLIVDWALCTFNGNKSIYIILPLVSLLVSIGIYYLYKEWKRIFPKNPYPDIAANLLILLTVASICFYQILLYFIVWPHTTQVLSLYSHYL